jgi:predicted NBD/HSP70 family sugar kinase
MDHFAGLDVSVKQTSICIVDDTGRVMKEVKVASEPEALPKVLGNSIYCFKRIGLDRRSGTVCASRVDHRAGGQASLACHLQLPLLCRCWRSSLVRR